MKLTNALLVGLGLLSFTYCKKKEEFKPKENYNNERTVSSAAFSTFDHTVTADQHIIDGTALGVKPGDVIGIESGTRTRVLLFKNIKGDANNPVTIVNKGGKVVLKSSGTYGMKFENSQYYRLTGTGDDKNEYGIEVDGGHISITMDKLSTNFEVDHIEIHNSGFAGLMAKTDPSCDEATWNGNFTMRNLDIHHNYVHHTKGEGFYIGNSFYAGGRNLSCGTIQPHAVEDVKLHHNITRYTGCEGIQVGCVIKGAEVYDNDVAYFGQDPFAAAQNNGIQIGEGTGGKLYNNIVANGPGNGLIILGLGDNLIYNNVVINPGTNGVFCDERYTTGPGFTFINNTFINPAQDGFKLYSELVSYNKLYNNIVVSPGGKYINTKSGVKLDDKNNLFVATEGEVKFKSPSNNDYSLTSSSPAIDKGMDASSFGITYDYLRASRPAGNGFDIGAYEFGGTPDSGGDNGGITDPDNGGDNGGTDPDNGGGTTDPDNGGDTGEPTDPDNGGDNGSGITEPETGIRVATLALIDANTNREIATLTEGYTLNLSTIGTDKFNVVAKTEGNVASVRFTYSQGSGRLENVAPYSLFGDASGNYNGVDMAEGKHTITATPYSEAKAQGTEGETLTINFTVEKQEAVNNAPVLGNLNNLSMDTESTKEIMINATDADNDNVTITVDNMPSFATLNGNKLSFNPGANDAGTYNMTVNANDGKGGSDSKSFTLTVEKKPVISNAIFNVTDDVFLQNGRAMNYGEVRVEKNRRVTYLKFDVKGLGTSKAERAILKIKVGSDKGYGPMKVYLGSNSNWSENNISGSTAPSKTSEVGVINTTYNSGTVYSIDVTGAINGDGTYTLILEKETGGNDVSFKAKESGQGAQLIIN